MSEMLTVDEVAAYFRVSKYTVYNWVRAGKLKVLRAGGVFRFRLDDIEEFVTEDDSEVA